MTKRIYICALVATLLSSATLADIRYRHINPEGLVVIADTPSDEAIERGYEIIDGNNKVIQTVPPQLDNEALAAHANNERIKQLENEKRDRYLLASFSTVQDIIDRKNRRLENLINEIAQMENNISRADTRRRQYEDQAANLQRAGQQVPASLIEKLQQIQNDRTLSEQQLLGLQSEYDEIESRFNAYVIRFQELGAVE